MRTVILDMGSGETCKNDAREMCRMVDAIAELDRKGVNLMLKWQLFESVPAGVAPLDHELYSHAVRYAEHRGLQTGASVFDLPSLRYLETFEPPFVKLACRPQLYWMHIYASSPLLISVDTPADFADWAVRLGRYAAGVLCCVPRYPAKTEDYGRFGALLSFGISDHTSVDDASLAQFWRPMIYECHFALPDQTGPDAGVIARHPADVQRLLSILGG